MAITKHFSTTSEAWDFALETGAKDNCTVIDYGIDEIGPYITYTTK